MHLNRKSAVVQTFLFCHELSRHFAGEGGDWYSKPSRTDICQFIRMIFLWTPLAIVMHLITMATIIFTVIYFPILVFGFGYMWFWIIVIICIAIIISVALISKTICIPKIKTPQITRDISGIITEGYRGFKEKFCPIIEFKENE